MTEKKQILLIDDNPIFGRTMMSALKFDLDAEFEIIQAHSFEDAIEKIDSDCPPDIVFTDFDLSDPPFSNTLGDKSADLFIDPLREACRRAQKKIGILLVTGQGGPADEVVADRIESKLNRIKRSGLPVTILSKAELASFGTTEDIINAVNDLAIKLERKRGASL